MANNARRVANHNGAIGHIAHHYRARSNKCVVPDDHPR
jgi:hypothetical protein